MVAIRPHHGNSSSVQYGTLLPYQACLNRQNLLYWYLTRRQGRKVLAAQKPLRAKAYSGFCILWLLRLLPRIGHLDTEFASRVSPPASVARGASYAVEKVKDVRMRLVHARTALAAEAAGTGIGSVVIGLAGGMASMASWRPV